MELHEQLREALELQVIEADGPGAAQVLQAAILDRTAVDVGDHMLDAAAVALRRMVLETNETMVAADLMARLALDGTLPDERIELLTDAVLMAAAYYWGPSGRGGRRRQRRQDEEDQEQEDR